MKTQFTFIEAAGGLIRNKNRHLFIFRLGKWDLPKGKLDANEAPREAALRECEEECGISGLTIISELPSTYHIYPYKGAHALKVTYWYAMQTDFSKKLIPQTEENIEKAEWLDAESIKKLVVKNTYPAILDVIKTGVGA
ncbi:MAG: NUDIX hydrolase [Bacteroidia bacterium]